MFRKVGEERLTYTEIKGDLFSVSEDYYLAHCISADFVMGAGIAPQFTKHFGTKYDLMRKYPEYIKSFDDSDCIKIGRVFNLISKKFVYQKPTYDSLLGALMKMYRICEREEITKLAMPKIGCGIDGLDWEKVSKLIKIVFEDLDIDIKIYYLE